MPLSQYQWEIVGECEECGATVYYNEDEGRLTSECDCMTVDPNSLPEWVKNDMGYEPEPDAVIEDLNDAREEYDSLVPYTDESKASDLLDQGLDPLDDDSLTTDLDTDYIFIPPVKND